MKKFVIAIVMAFICLVTYAQQPPYYRFTKDGVTRVERTPEDELTIGEYHFKCYEYNKVKGGGTYYLDDVPREDIRMMYVYLLENKYKIETKYNILIANLKVAGGIAIEAYDLDKYNEWCAERLEHRKEIMEKFGL